MSWSYVKKLEKPAELLLRQRWLHLPRLPTVRAASSSARRKPLNRSRGFSTLCKTQEAGRHLDWILFGPEQVSADWDEWEATACVSTSLVLSSSLSTAPATVSTLTLLRPWTRHSTDTRRCCSCSFEEPHSLEPGALHFLMPYFFFLNFASRTIAIRCNKGTTCAAETEQTVVVIDEQPHSQS